ncbi:DUF4124 domain-containing protein [Variovorax sp. PBL-E5]|uniref:DUF4124 domain-containing protein n=1 Tax=Variovorax sp. PBL-E5 TaxID=434014 RepID=UPI00131875D1|nr:DUF4124 domain-containing protein [Variovorax sp. PBL-E5]VTU30550.1 hypothetical protein E5CHR_03037 [Variovorax sp. PBL-E5]
MRRLLPVAILLMLGLPCSAEVIRCADAAGNVSYTDGACPAGARQVGRVATPPAVRTPDESGQSQAAGSVDSPYADAPRREPAPVVAPPMPPPPQQAPAGPVVIDSRGDDPGAGDDDGYPGAYRRPLPPRDMRPRLRDCDRTGCRDTQGNHYNRAGQLDRYQGPGGKTCQPVGTTVICH